MPKFGVVIPYFQRRPGILSATLASVSKQDVKAPVRIIVVDDSSPVPAEQEVTQVNFPANITIQVIRQPNAGPGAARNRGIDALADADYIAFLDSDDEWLPHHLSSALLAFEYGFDYYTAETEEGGSGFKMHADFFNGTLPLRPHPAAQWANELIEPLINFTVRGPVSGSSTFVVKRELIGDTRFSSKLRTAGEDGLFTTTLAAKSPRVMVSTRTDVILGKGVNIFSEGTWGDRSGTLRAIYFLRSRILMRPIVHSFKEAESEVEKKILKARQELWKSVFANIRRGNFPWAQFISTVRFDPALLAAAPRAVIDMALRR